MTDVKQWIIDATGETPRLERKEDGGAYLCIGGWQMACPPLAPVASVGDAIRCTLQQANLYQRARTVGAFCEATGDLSDGLPTDVGRVRALLARNANNIYTSLLTTRQREELGGLVRVNDE